MGIHKFLKNLNLKRQKGFTLGETVASMMSLVVVALSAQSLILMSNQFQSNQNRSFSSLESQNHFHNRVCSQLRNPTAVQVDRSRTYYYDNSDPSNPVYMSLRRERESKKPTMAFVLDNNFAFGSLNLTDNGITYTDDLTGAASRLTDKSIFKIEDGEETSSPNSEYSRPEVLFLSYLPIFSDSHTIINYIPKKDHFDSLEKGAVEESSYILATRCFKNEDFHDGKFRTIIDSFDGDISRTPDSSEATQRALFILSNQKVPFYFPDENGIKKVYCADHADTIPIPSDPNDAGYKEYTPATFFIEFEANKSGTVVRDIKDNTKPSGYTNPPNGNGAITSFDISRNDGSNADSEMKLSNTCDFSDCDSQEDSQDHEYRQKIRKEFSTPVIFNSILEIPFIEESSKIWTSTFMATSSTEQYSSFFHLNFVDVENNCNPYLFECPIYPKVQSGETLDDLVVPHKGDSANANSKKIYEFFSYRIKFCPFRYTSLENSGQAVPLGFSIESK